MWPLWTVPHPSKGTLIWPRCRTCCSTPDSSKGHGIFSVKAWKLALQVQGWREQQFDVELRGRGSHERPAGAEVAGPATEELGRRAAPLPGGAHDPDG